MLYNAMCTGCMACMNACPVNAISELQDEKGFYVPHIASERCIECGECKAVCPALHKPVVHAGSSRIYACWSKDEALRQVSTSGGLFGLLAQETIDNGGVVFGAVMNEHLCVEHRKADSIGGIQQIRGSKYVQSRIGMTYRDVKTSLNTGMPVLFSGTPCQIAALRNYLGKEYDNLLLIDVLCHGVPSPSVFGAYIAYMQNKFAGDVIKSVNFRNKSHSWDLYRMQIEFESGTIYSNDRLTDPLTCPPILVPVPELVEI